MVVSVQVDQLLRTWSTVVDFCKLDQLQKLDQLLQSWSTATNWINYGIADCYSNMKIGDSEGEKDLFQKIFFMYKAGKEGCSLQCPRVLGHACEHLMSLASKGNYDIAKFHPHEKTTKYWQEEMAAGGTFPLPPTDEDIDQLSHLFQPEKRMPGVIKNKTGRKPRRKSARERAADFKAKKDKNRHLRALKVYKARPNKKK